MIKIMRDGWLKNRNNLRSEIEQLNPHNIDYGDLVKMVFDIIYNGNSDEPLYNLLDTNRITKIDNGDYQGTLLYIIPFNTYQPSAGEYLMTYIEYGSCSVCDTLQRITNLSSWSDTRLKITQVDDLLSLCKDIVMNTIKPYNNGWRYNAEYDVIEE